MRGERALGNDIKGNPLLRKYHSNLCTRDKGRNKGSPKIQTFPFVLSARASPFISGGASVTLQMLEIFLDGKT